MTYRSVLGGTLKVGTNLEAELARKQVNPTN